MGKYFCNIVVEVHAKLKLVGLVESAGGVKIKVLPATPLAATPALFIVTVITPESLVTAESAYLPATAKSAAFGVVAAPGYAPLV